MFYKKASLLLLIPIASVLSACVSTAPLVEEIAVVSELPPMEKPGINPKTRVVEFDNRNGNERYYDILALDSNGNHNGENNDGCKWLNSGDHVSPALSWDDCSTDPEWNSGKNINQKKTGEIWPLAVGKKVTYSYTQVNAQGQNKGSTSRKCEVVEQVNITTALGNMDTYKVSCFRRKGDWSKTRIFYFSPEHEYAVKYLERSSSEGVERDRELVRVESL